MSEILTGMDFKHLRAKSLFFRHVFSKCGNLNVQKQERAENETKSCPISRPKIA